MAYHDYTRNGYMSTNSILCNSSSEAQHLSNVYSANLATQQQRLISSPSVSSSWITNYQPQNNISQTSSIVVKTDNSIDCTGVKFFYEQQLKQKRKNLTDNFIPRLKRLKYWYERYLSCNYLRYSTERLASLLINSKQQVNIISSYGSIDVFDIPTYHSNKWPEIQQYLTCDDNKPVCLNLIDEKYQTLDFIKSLPTGSFLDMTCRLDERFVFNKLLNRYE